MRKAKNLFLILAFLPFLNLAPALAASTNPLNAACQGSNVSSSEVCQQAGSQGTNNPIAGQGGIISTGATIIAIIAGIGAVIMIILGGLTLVTSGGNPESTKKARQQITSALIGLVVIALAWTLVRFITDRVVG